VPDERTNGWGVMYGNPLDGFRVVGPFATEDEADEYGGQFNLGHEPRWTVELEAPDARWKGGQK
jgi:hypothetical protein